MPDEPLMDARIESGSAMLRAKARRTQVLVAFAALYLVWGSTYLAIRFAIETIPPFLMAGARFLVAGAVLFAFARVRGAARPTRRQLVACTIVGALLLLGGNGAVVWAEQRVPSGVASLLVATVPCWMVLLDWLRPRGRRPTFGVTAGLFLGLVGLGLLVGLDDLRGAGGVDHMGALALVLGSLAWSAGSIASKRLPLPADPLAATGLEMLMGGLCLLAAGVGTGEVRDFHPAAVTLHSVLAWGYLVVFGSWIGFTAYIWLLRVVPPARVATYAYVNPIVAVFLGWLLAGEPLTARMAVAAAVIVAAVATITVAQSGANAPTMTGEHAVPPAAERPSRTTARRSRQAV